MAITTNYSWSTPDDTALVKDGASAIRTLGTSADTTVKNLNPETTLGDIAYRSSSANVKTRLGIGSSGQVLTVAAGVPSWATPSSSPLTTKGDIFTFSTVAARLAVGTNGQVLTADSTEATGLKFATPAAGGGMTLLSTTTLSTTTTTIGISASTYKNLYLLINGINLSGSDYVYFETNGTANKFDYIKSSGYNIGGVSTDMNVAADFNLNYTIQNGGNADNSFIINIYDHVSTTKFKTFNATTGFFDNSSRRNASISGGIIRDTAAITTCRFFTGGATMNAGTVYIYGVN